MKRFQYSISGIFALTFLVAIVLSLRGGLGSQWSFETIWIAVFVLAYWKSPNKGWRQVVRATGTTGVVWGVLIVCVYAWFFNRRGAPGAIDLAIHGAILVLAAVLLAMAGACLVEGIRVAVRFLRRCTWPRRVVVAVALVASIPRVAVGWMGLRGSYWEPATVTSAAEAFDAAFPWLPSVQQKPELKYVRPGLPSPDGRFVAAILNGAQRVRVFDSARSKVVATLTAGRDEQFADLTFDRDGSVLAALVYSKSAGPKLARWDIPGWTPRESVPLDHLVGGARPGERTHLSLDRCLLLVRTRALNEHTGMAEISTVDLADERLVPRAFASAEVPIITVRDRGAVLGFVVQHGWIVSPGGDWICGGRRCVSRADSAATELPGRALGFFRDTDCLALYEECVAFRWKGEKLEPVPPPFWDYARTGFRYRVKVYDCRTQRVIARSRWFTELQEPRMSPDGSQVLAEQGDSVLIWEFPQVAPHRDTRFDQRS